jgi:type I restriction-modification system DNA methylase subunit
LTVEPGIGRLSESTNTSLPTMSELTFTDVFERLLEDYSENNNEDEDFNPEAFEEYLNGLPEEEIIEKYNDLTGEEVTLESTVKATQQ